jgi:hypothetical protein
VAALRAATFILGFGITQIQKKRDGAKRHLFS